jgi:hypothetical protein
MYPKHSIFYLLMQPFELVNPTLTKVHLFGFAEFITALAVLLALFSMTSVRYRFRVKITPFVPIDKFAYYSFIFVGVFTLILEYFYAKGWRLPEIFSNSLNMQAFLGALFFSPVALWIYFAFIKPPRFGWMNARRYYDCVTDAILSGTNEELSIVANEISQSSKSIIRYAKNFNPKAAENREAILRSLAHDILLLLGYKRFCQYVMSSSPGLGVNLFSQITKQQAYELPVNQLAVNLFSEALINSDSILYHEDSLYESGLIGYCKPFSESLFSDYHLVETLNRTGRTLFDVSYKITSVWNSSQIEAFSSCLLIFFKAYLSNLVANTASIYSITFATGLEKLVEENGYESAIPGIGGNKSVRVEYINKLNERVQCLGQVIWQINSTDGLPSCRLRSSNDPHIKDFYDTIVDAMLNVIFEASYVKCDVDFCWTTQYVIVFFRFFSDPCRYNKIVSHRLRRAIYNKIKELQKFPNYKYIRILGFFLNTMGLTLSDKSNRNKGVNALHKVILNWTKHNFMKIFYYNNEIAEACLMGAVTFDKKQLKLVKSYHKDLQGNTPQEHLDLIDSKFENIG